MDNDALIRAWARELGWAWPATAMTPSGVFGAVAERLGVSSEYVRRVYGGRASMPAAWPERWDAAGGDGPPVVPRAGGAE